MEKNRNIKYISIYNYLNKKVLVEYFNPNCIDEKKRLNNNAENLIDKLNLIGLTNNERHTENLKTDKILVVLDSRALWFYCLAVQYTYPERLGYQLLNNLLSKYNKILQTQLIDVNSNNAKQLINEIQLTMTELEEKYRDPAKTDTIYAINEDIHDLNHIMKKNIMKVVDTEDDIKGLQLQTENIKDSALIFKDNSKTLRKATYWQNKKLAVVGGTLFTGAIGFIIFKFFL